MKTIEIKEYTKEEASIELLNELSLSENNKLYTEEEVKQILKERFDEISN